MSSSFQSLRVITDGFAGIAGATNVAAPPLRPEELFPEELFRRSRSRRFASFSARRFSSFLCFTSALTSALLLLSSGNTMKSWPLSLIHSLLSAVLRTKTMPSSPTGAVMVHAAHPGAPATGSISVSQLAPPVPQLFAGSDRHPCGGAVHSPAGSDCVAQCRTRSRSERVAHTNCKWPSEAFLASTTMSFTVPSPMLSSLRHSTGVPPARWSHRRATSAGESSTAGAAEYAGVRDGVVTMELAEAGSARAAAGIGGGGAQARPAPRRRRRLPPRARSS